MLRPCPKWIPFKKFVALVNDVGVEDKRAELIELHDELLVKLDDLRQKIEDF